MQVKGHYRNLTPFLNRKVPDIRLSMMEEITQLLDLERWGPIEEVNSVIYAKFREDLQPPRSDIAVSRPLPTDWLEKTVTFAKPASETSVRRLFSLCNGLRVGATRFATYAVLTDEYPGTGTRLDINVPNIYERPDFISEKDLIVGFGYLKQSAAFSEVSHVISESGDIYLVNHDSPTEVFRSYECVDDWLVSEFNHAASETRFD